MGFSMFIAHAINCFDAMALITNGNVCFDAMALITNGNVYAA